MKSLYKFLIVAVATFWAGSCTNLDLQPLSNINAELVYNDPATYRAFIARVYAGLAITGQQGPAGNGDIKGIDEGFSNYLRQYWKAQVLSTDEAVIAWGDEGLQDYHAHIWTPANQFVTAMYNRIFFQVGMANEFLRETSDAKLDERDVDEDLRAEIQAYRAEARFLRAFSYWHGIDMFGNIPLVDENFAIGAEGPDQSTRAEIFSFIESELKAIESALPDAGQAEYGRADKGALWALLAKLYLNAEVYIGQNRYTDCITYCKKIIDSGAYSLMGVYEHNFGADNHTSPEFIFAINFDGESTRTWGGTTFLTHAPVGGSMVAADYGVDGGWFGSRTTPDFVALFPDETGDIDTRANFYTDGQTLEINSVSVFNDGYAVVKFINLNADGTPGKNATFPDTDFPVFRLADIYLMYTEAIVRGGQGGDKAEALGYVNEIRQRAYGDNSGDIGDADLTLDFILDERARELYWEGHRRTDLIRFDQFSDNGVWAWKGGVKEGTTTSAHLDLFPIPSSEIIANPKLDQNDGY